MKENVTDINLALMMDAEDPLASFREEFLIADPDTIYLDGNSLGRLPRRSAALLQQAVEREWGERLIRAWGEGWMDLPTALGRKIAALLGAQEDEVVVTDATSLNLFKLAVAALQARPDRGRIVSDALNFPSDLYVLQGIARLLGKQHTLVLVPSADGIEIQLDALAEAIDAQTALVCLTHVAFKSAFMHDMHGITRLAHEAGALTLWDLSHSVGAVPLRLGEWEVDLAVGCTYKYLNGGPGAPAFLYVRRELQEQLNNPIWGWLAAQDPFAFDLDFSPSLDINRFRVGTHAVLSLRALEPALDLILDAGMARLCAKSRRQSEYLIKLTEEWLMPFGFTLGSPRDPGKRGSHVSLRHPDGYRIVCAMLQAAPPAPRVIPDFRVPDNIRLGIAPLYTSFLDIHRALDRMRIIMEQKLYEQYPDKRAFVT
jgi:kynureninase